MDIKILNGKAKKVSEGRNGYKVEFIDTKVEHTDIKEYRLGYSLEVISGSLIDVFLKYWPNDCGKIAVLDGRVIALINDMDQIELVRDVILPGCEGLIPNGNLDYIEETYGVQIDALKAELADLVKTSHLSIYKLKVDDKSCAYGEGINIHLSKERRVTNIYCPDGTLQANFILKIAGVEDGNYFDALEKLMGREIYVITCGTDVIGFADKETKEICVLRAFYFGNSNGEDNQNINNLETRYGIDPNSLDERTKMLIKNNESSNRNV